MAENENTSAAPQKIVPFLWFDNNAEEAINFYCSIFKNARIGHISRNETGNLFTGTFYLHGQEFMVLNGGPMFKFTEAISLFVKCADQAEVDYYWEKLTSDGGEESMCGWLKDKYGLSWQIVPDALGKLLGGPDPVGSKNAMMALMKMRKIDVAVLEAAYHG